MNVWWNRKTLEELSRTEWEALCDSCAKCCLHKLEDEDDGEVVYTKVRCRYLNAETCRCSDYSRRTSLVPSCLDLKVSDWHGLDWLPSTCAYRLRSRGERLPSWHPLESGSAHTVHEAGVSIRGRAISEEYVHPDGLDEHIVHWVE